MTLKELSQLYYLNREIEMDRQRLQELEHAEKLHKMVVRIIEKYRQTGAPASAAMLAVWDWEHEKMVDRTVKIRNLLNM